MISSHYYYYYYYYYSLCRQQYKYKHVNQTEQSTNLCTSERVGNLLQSHLCIETHVAAIAFKCHAVDKHKRVAFEAQETNGRRRKCLRESLSLVIANPAKLSAELNIAERDNNHIDHRGLEVKHV